MAHLCNENPPWQFVIFYLVQIKKSEPLPGYSKGLLCPEKVNTELSGGERFLFELNKIVASLSTSRPYFFHKKGKTFC